MKDESKEKDLKLELLEMELEALKIQLTVANTRADKAEEELRKYKEAENTQTFKRPVPPPPPPPPALPMFSLSSKHSGSTASLSDAINQTKLQHTDSQVEKPQPQGKYSDAKKIFINMGCWFFNPLKYYLTFGFLL